MRLTNTVASFYGGAVMNDTDIRFMKQALELAHQAALQNEVPVGALIVKDGEILAQAHNLTEQKCSPTRHAEMIVIENACGVLGSRRLTNCTLYVTLEPCPMCTGALIQARVAKIVYAAPDPRAGACGSLLNLPAYPLECRPVIEGGLLQNEALELLRSFFVTKRRNPINSLL